MEKKIFKTTIGKALDEYGFRFVKKSHYKETEELIVVVSTQKSSFDDSQYINYGFLIKNESPEVKYPKDNECDVIGRFIFQIKGKKSDNIDLNSLNEEELSNAVKENVEKVIMPVLDFGLAKYFEMYPELLVTANLKAKKHLNL